MIKRIKSYYFLGMYWKNKENCSISAGEEWKKSLKKLF